MGHPVRVNPFPTLLSLALVGAAGGLFVFAVALDVEFVGVLQLDRWPLLICDGQLAKGSELRWVSLFPHEGTPVSERWCP
jgi:hypothetical protein